MSPPPLPLEVVCLILDADDGLLLEDVVRASYVSRSWRDGARSHPLYWRDIIFSSPRFTRRDVHLFLDRLYAVPYGDLNLSICLEDSDFADDSVKDDVRTMVMPALSHALPRLVTLYLQCDDEFIPDVLDALRARIAPRLELFHFYYPPGEDRMTSVRDVLPHDLFMGHAPLLEELQLDAVQFPVAGPVAALAAVRKLTRMVNRDAGVTAVLGLHPERFFVSCPALKELSLNGDGLELGLAWWVACPPPSQTKLDHLTVTNGSAEAIVRTFAHRDMLSITVDAVDASRATVGLMLGTLDGSATLQLDLLGDERSLECSVLNAARTHWRSFTHSREDAKDASEILNSEAILAAAFACIARRITHVAVSDSDYAWSHFDALFPDSAARLVNVHTLELVLLEEQCPDLDAERPMALPALAELRLVADGGLDSESRDMVLDVTELLFFVKDMLDVPEGRKLRLVLEDVHLSGDTNVLVNLFQNIR